MFQPNSLEMNCDALMPMPPTSSDTLAMEPSSIVMTRDVSVAVSLISRYARHYATFATATCTRAISLAGPPPRELCPVTTNKCSPAAKPVTS